jgi:hypothetical protein
MRLSESQPHSGSGLNGRRILPILLASPISSLETHGGGGGGGFGATMGAGGDMVGAGVAFTGMEANHAVNHTLMQRIAQLHRIQSKAFG